MLDIVEYQVTCWNSWIESTKLNVKLDELNIAIFGLSYFVQALQRHEVCKRWDQILYLKQTQIRTFGFGISIMKEM